ncbi:MAG: adenylosuccinate lyase, partial [Candidatus Omnitrophica bacterium]|nr:adenylosuccinate lyase [Candidatus Omnitrophota bacterium]
IARMTAYDMVQSAALNVINNKTTFKKEILEDKAIRKYLTEKEIEDIFEPKSYLANVDKIYKRVEKI